MLGLGLFLLCFALHVFANTEIVNFRVSEAREVDFPFTNQWPRLNYTHNDLEWDIRPAAYATPLKEVCEDKTPDALDPCPHELWILLDLRRDWSTYSSFTLRLSWPASYPADFSIQLYDPQALLNHFGVDPAQHRHLPTESNSRRRYRYARIRLVDTGVLTPRSSSSDGSKPVPVPFIITLEPLYFRVLPPSVLPVLGFIAVACIVAGLAVPKIHKYLNSVAVQAKKELAANGKHE
ncbi:hypothetical protein DXG03_002848 [Asterophora parasitica]|uniref:Phosphatidylinositol-glycan biosynthesis class X protein n=1 Tax=Asterophora parasitica TaxID=117018 RepID=A0A9P7KAZ3_9AGAR|nr:hypothetical protein DXG03_002848 [Asterophora parasitica]